MKRHYLPAKMQATSTVAANQHNRRATAGQLVVEALGMPADVVDVEVDSERVGHARGGGDGIEFPVSPLLTRYTCTLEYRPWPSSFTIAGVSYRAPLVLHHKRELVVDRYRGGVVV